MAKKKKAAAPAKKATKKAAAAKAKAPQPLTKSQLIGNLSEKTELTKKEVELVLDALETEIKESLQDNGPGVFVLPNLLKIRTKTVPARPAGERFNPATRQMEMREAKPESLKVDVKALKRLQDVVAEQK